jgi:hypothetical protein
MLGVLDGVGVSGARAPWLHDPALLALGAGLGLLLISLYGWRTLATRSPVARIGIATMAAGYAMWLLDVADNFAPEVLPFPISENAMAVLVAIGLALFAIGFWHDRAQPRMGLLMLGVCGPIGMLMLAAPWPLGLGALVPMLVMLSGIGWVRLGFAANAPVPAAEVPAGRTSVNRVSLPRTPRERTLAALAVVLCAGCIAASLLAQRSAIQIPWFGSIAPVAVAYAAVGAAVIWRRASNPIGWVFCSVGLVQALSVASAAYALDLGPGQTDLAAWGLWISSWTWPLGAFLGITLLLLLVPDGRVGSATWRGIGTIGVCALVVITAIGWFRPGPITALPPGAPLVDNPLGFEGAPEARRLLEFVAYVILSLTTVAAIARLLQGLDRTRDHPRREFKWVACGAVLAGGAVLIDQFIPGVAGVTGPGQAAIAVGFAALPVSVGVAMLRHGFYTVDTVLNGRRTQ